MNLTDRVNIALKAIDKNMDYSELFYCDDMNGNQDQTPEVWRLVIKCKGIGRIGFEERYRDYITQ